MRCLILGGSYFIGKAFFNSVKNDPLFTIYRANRGSRNNTIASENDLILDRTLPQSCSILSDYHFDVVVDFSCLSVAMLNNVVTQLNNPYYVLISSGYAELSDPHHSDYHYGSQKLQCEQLVQQKFSETLIVRPGYVMGEDDYTGRFEKDPLTDTYYYKNSTHRVEQYIDVHLLTSSLINLIQHRQLGLVKMGYI